MIWAVECDVGTGWLSVANLLFLEMGEQFDPQDAIRRWTPRLESQFQDTLFAKTEADIIEDEISNCPVTLRNVSE